jgi:thiamine biosynthesis lipoprotein
MTANHNENRRSFLKRSGLLGLGVAASTILPVASAEALWFNRKEYKVTRTKLGMGTYISMTAIHPSKDEAEEAFGLAFAEIDRLNNLLSRFNESSPVATLNRTGSLQNAPVEVLELVSRSLFYHSRTDGAFDITVTPLIDLYKNSFAAGAKPTDAEVQATLQQIGAEQIIYNNGNISFAKSDMAITLDGIAKGYIVDKASEILSANGLHNHLINAGGDIRTAGAAANKKPWTVAIQDPAKGKHYPNIITMNDGAVATSGNYEIFYDNEKMFHHIIDAKTGLSPTLSTSVTVRTATVMDADALSTSVFVMQPKHGLAFINSHINSECFIIGKDGDPHQSKGWTTA